ncbi:hypothetical protein O978_12910, partial [Mycobacterium avium subsp. paratuberculosis 10-5864]
MGCSSREEIVKVFDALDAAVDRLGELSFDALTPRECLSLLQRCETVRRRLPVPEHPLINALARDASPAELGGRLSHAIAEATLISRAEPP